MIRMLKKQGVGIIYISHRLDELFEITDRIEVLRDGMDVGTFSTATVERSKLGKYDGGTRINKILYEKIMCHRRM